jgi:SRSO17 transposase
MGASERFERYMEHLGAGLGHADRHARLKGYCTGLMLPLSRKSVEPMAASIEREHCWPMPATASTPPSGNA